MEGGRGVFLFCIVYVHGMFIMNNNYLLFP